MSKIWQDRQESLSFLKISRGGSTRDLHALDDYRYHSVFLNRIIKQGPYDVGFENPC